LAAWLSCWPSVRSNCPGFALAPAIGLSFATLDVVCDNDGQHNIIDVNTTPYIDVAMASFSSRAAGIIDYRGGGP